MPYCQEGRSALMAAARGGNIECFEILERAGASVLLLSQAGDSVLHCASAPGSLDMLTFLLQRDSLRGVIDAPGVWCSAIVPLCHFSPGASVHPLIKAFIFLILNAAFRIFIAVGRTQDGADACGRAWLSRVRTVAP
eukprot:m.771856 g.771856  ORF g.771856 m.771856 type:complete len:137 (+) comp59096_c0_seq14:279-689(+)